MTVPPSTVATSVRAELRAAGLTQERIGEALGIAQVGISRRVRGKTPWRADELLLLSERFDIPLSRLYGTDEVPASPRPAGQAAAS